MPGLMQKLGWAVDADPELGFAMEASACLRQSGVEVTTSEVALTATAAMAYTSGLWSADTPLEEVFELGDRTPTGYRAAHTDEGDDADVWMALTREEATLTWGGEPAECAVRRKLLAKLTRGIDAVRATHLVGGLTAPARTEMLSSGGPGVREHLDGRPHQS